MQYTPVGPGCPAATATTWSARSQSVRYDPAVSGPIGGNARLKAPGQRSAGVGTAEDLDIVCWMLVPLQRVSRPVLNGYPAAVSVAARGRYHPDTRPAMVPTQGSVAGMFLDIMKVLCCQLDVFLYNVT